MSLITKITRGLDALSKTKDRKTRKDVKSTPGATFKKKSIFFEYLSY